MLYFSRFCKSFWHFQSLRSYEKNQNAIAFVAYHLTDLNPISHVDNNDK